MAKANKATVAAPVEEILRIPLDGAQFWDIKQYVAEKEADGAAPWTVPEGGKPLADRTLWFYIQRADRLVKESCSQGRKRLFRNHLAKRRNLYAKAVLSGDYSTAARLLADEARLLGLYPEEKVRLKGKVAAAVSGQLTVSYVDAFYPRPQAPADTPAQTNGAPAAGAH